MECQTFLPINIWHTFPYHNLFVTDTEGTCQTLEQWLYQNLKLSHTTQSVIAINILVSDVALRQNLEWRVLQFVKTKDYKLSSFKIQQDLNKSSVILTKNIVKCQLLISLRRIRINRQVSDSKLCQIEYTDQLLHLFMKIFPDCWEMEWSIFIKWLVFQTLDEKTKYMKYSLPNQVNIKIANVITSVQSNVSPGDVILSNYRQKSPINQLYLPQSIKRLLKVKQIHSLFYNQIFVVKKDDLKPETAIKNFTHSRIWLRTHFNQLSVKFVLKNVKKIIINCGIGRVFQLYIIQGVKNQATESNIRVINSYLLALQQKLNYKKMKGFQSSQAIQRFVKSLQFKLLYLRVAKMHHQKNIQSKMIYFKTSLQFSKRKINYLRVKVELTIRSFLIKSRARNQHNKVYFFTKTKQLGQLKTDYEEMVIRLNDKMKRDVQMYGGRTMQCQTILIQVRSMFKDLLFSPGKVQNFFMESLTYARQARTSWVKLQANATFIKVYFQNGKVWMYGYYPQICPTINHQLAIYDSYQLIEAADGSYLYVIDSQRQLFSKGSNQYGQLGIGSTQKTHQLRRVPIKDRIKCISTKSNRTLCLTQTQKLYTWGLNESSSEVITIPKIIKTEFLPKNSLIDNVNCSHSQNYLLLNNGSIFELTNNKYIRYEVKANIKTSAWYKKDQLRQSDLQKKQKNTENQKNSTNTTKCQSRESSYLSIGIKNNLHYERSSKGNQRFTPDFCLIDTIGGAGLEITYLRRIRINCFDETVRKAIKKWLKKDRNQHSFINDESLLIESRVDKFNFR